MHRRFALVLSASMLVAACSGSDDDAASTTAAPVDDSTDITSDEEPVEEAAEDPVAEDAAEDVEAEDEPAEEAAPATPAVTAAAIEPSANIGLAALVTVDADAPVQVRLSAASGDHVVETPPTAAITDRHELPLVGLRPDRPYDVTVHLLGDDGEEFGTHEAGTFSTEPLPGWFVEHELTIIDPQRVSPGFTIIEFDQQFAGELPPDAPSPQYLVAYDDEGEIVWWYTNTGTLAGVEQTDRGTFMNFYWPFGIRETDVLGNLVGHWAPQPRSLEEVGEAADLEAAVEDIDPDQIQFQGGIPTTNGNEGDPLPIPFVVPWLDVTGIHHEAWPMPNGNILTLSITEHELTPEQRATFCPNDDREFNAISDVAIEFEPDGTVVRTWDLWDAVDIDEIQGTHMCIDAGIFAGDDNRDWNHANSVIYDPVRDAVIISSRHTDQIIAFDHLDEEGPQTQVRWILGRGATIPFDGEPTYYQHAVEVNEDGTLVIYDNGNFRPGTTLGDPDNAPYSRAVIYEVDDASDDRSTWSARQVWEHIDLDDGVPVFTSFVGDADVLANGNVLITHGGRGAFPVDPANPLNLLVREVVPSGSSGGDVVWELRSNPDVPHVTYRAERIESFYVGPLWQS